MTTGSDDPGLAGRETLYLAIDQGTHASRAVVLDRRGRVHARAAQDDRAVAAAARLGGAGRRRDGRLDRHGCRRGIGGAGRSPARRRGGRACEPARELRLLGSARRPPAVARFQLAGPPRARWLAPVRAARRRGASQDRAVPLGALRREQVALGARSPAGGARGARRGHAVLGTTGRASSFSGCSTSTRFSPIRSARRARSSGICRPATGIPSCLHCSGCRRVFLPKSVPTCHRYGTLRSGDAAIPLLAVNGDQSAAVFAFGWPEGDSAYVNIGTSAFVQRVLTRDPGYVPRQLTGIILDDGERHGLHGRRQRQRRRAPRSSGCSESSTIDDVMPLLAAMARARRRAACCS